ncbi:MAG: histidinol dehydrogenase, partial [Lachnospiraceae bacterium]|nr:histidinol dehydrogenase [Lachnospiraceae bacterium]
MRIINLTQESKKNILNDLLKRSPNNYGKFEETVNEILANVKANGDKALFEYTKKFDRYDLNAENIQVTRAEIDEAYTKLDAKLIEVIRKSAENIRVFHSKQLRNSWFDAKPDGTILGMKITALEKVGVYVPGGKAAYPSSVLMNVVPAKVA